MERMKRRQNNNGLSTEEWRKYWKAVDDYLRETFDIDQKLEKGEVLPAAEIKRILRENFERYFKGEVDQKFIISLGTRIYELCMGDIKGSELEQILDIACPLDDITAGISKQKSPEEIDQLIHQLFEKHFK